MGFEDLPFSPITTLLGRPWAFPLPQCADTPPLSLAPQGSSCLAHPLQSGCPSYFTLCSVSAPHQSSECECVLECETHQQEDMSECLTRTCGGRKHLRNLGMPGRIRLPRCPLPGTHCSEDGESAAWAPSCRASMPLGLFSLSYLSSSQSTSPFSKKTS